MTKIIISKQHALGCLTNLSVIASEAWQSPVLLRISIWSFEFRYYFGFSA
jgi:hypothetical protein